MSRAAGVNFTSFGRNNIVQANNFINQVAVNSSILSGNAIELNRPSDSNTGAMVNTLTTDTVRTSSIMRLDAGATTVALGDYMFIGGLTGGVGGSSLILGSNATVPDIPDGMHIVSCDGSDFSANDITVTYVASGCTDLASVELIFQERGATDRRLVVGAELAAIT